MDVVQEAAIKGGWQVGHTSPGVVTLVPYRPPADVNHNITLRANVLGSDTARVIVSGTDTDRFGQGIGRILQGEGGEATSTDAAIKQATKGRSALPWSELQRFAEAIRVMGNGTSPRPISGPIMLMEPSGRAWYVDVRPPNTGGSDALRFAASNGEVRELVGYPETWRAMTDAELMALLGRTKVVRRH